MAKKAEKITMEKLAVMIKHGFDDVDEKFKKVDERFDKMDERFDKVDERFDKIENDIKEFKAKNTWEHENLTLRQDNVAYRFELIALTKRMEIVEKAVARNGKN